MRPEDKEAAEELAGVRQLQQQQLALKVGFNGLQIAELHGESQSASHECGGLHSFLRIDTGKHRS